MNHENKSFCCTLATSFSDESASPQVVVVLVLMLRPFILVARVSTGAQTRGPASSTATAAEVDAELAAILVGGGAAAMARTGTPAVLPIEAELAGKIRACGITDAQAH